MTLVGRHLVQPADFSVEEIESVLDLGLRIKEDPSKYIRVAEGKLLATLFYEPSTRTRLSFEAAMNRLGGRIIGFSDPGASSVSKGESLEDTITTVSNYVDVIAMRHPISGAAIQASKACKIPFINAGDGKNQHPTQTLTDLLTIKACRGQLNNLTIAMCGDLKYGRTVHSLAKAMSRYTDTKFIFIAPDELKMPEEVLNDIEGINYEQTASLEEAIGKCDILYMTRVQRERFEDKAQYERLKDTYILDVEKMSKAKENMLVLHPLPRVNEIAVEVDQDPRAKYFEQAQYGMYVRMALIMKLLGIGE
ncbi:aspartate carbamoyltransferase [Peptostreptococcus equinus]|uniref:Aspartate carbamoyltransferase n=1 Tax=Peptostreptococcus equinus TaxID=3003601 RepID=A0ABY7JRP8_9FIRM|nr:aspartate carbamoyltransferase [Peptostreptococcus sp. CBA3647]WAW14655.1 aspartate carbamoyltransferase [Peptostreptococcus sp. CBA3647]